MYRPVTPHGDAGSAVEFGDLITIPGGECLHVFVEEGRYLDFKRFRHDLSPELSCSATSKPTRIVLGRDTAHAEFGWRHAVQPIRCWVQLRATGLLYSYDLIRGQPSYDWN
jgi:hypothetical protein